MNQGLAEERRNAIDLAWSSLDDMDPSVLSNNARCRLAGGRLLLPHFEGGLTIDLARRSVTMDGKEVDEATTILALHYLSGCGQETARGTLVPFNQAKGGDVYYEAFRHRTIDRLAKEFGEDPGSLIRAGGRVGGMDVRLGDASIQVRVFPKVWVTVIVWQGDEEVPSSANVLFDSSVLDILPTEDLAVIGSLVVARLVKAKAML